MIEIIKDSLAAIAREGNLRRLPAEGVGEGMVDFSSNDYLGLSARIDLQVSFLESLEAESGWLMGASASRLLATRQESFGRLERTLEEAYADGRRALFFNSGYHANTGIVSALALPGTIVIADRLVHASIIDGLRLGGARFERFRHNDLGHLETLLARAASEGLRPLIIVESVYSMDGDEADIGSLVALKKKYGATLYVDEAHAVGVCGPGGLGLGAEFGAEVDITVGTFGKALGGTGAFAMCSDTMRQWLVNRARSLIFSTATAPINALWNDFIFRRMQHMDAERHHLRELGRALGRALGSGSQSHIQPFMVGDPERAVRLSAKLREEGLLVLPIRRPTVPPGTDRLRISLSAALSAADVERLANALKNNDTK